VTRSSSSGCGTDAAIGKLTRAVLMHGRMPVVDGPGVLPFA